MCPHPLAHPHHECLKRNYGYISHAFHAAFGRCAKLLVNKLFEARETPVGQVTPHQAPAVASLVMLPNIELEALAGQ